MNDVIKVALAGAGAFGTKHLDAIMLIDGRRGRLRSWAASSTRRRPWRTSTASATSPPTSRTASRARTSTRSSLCTPTQMHAAQAIACLAAGKHVQVEIPLAEACGTRRRCCGRSRRPARWRWSATPAASTPATSGSTGRSAPGEFAIQQMDVQTFFFRRTNMNALGQPRSWTDHLLWHHSAHTVDLFAYQTGGDIGRGECPAGPDPPGARHRDGHVDPAQGLDRRDLHAVAFLQQRRPARHVLPLHRRTRAPTSPATTTSTTARTRRSTCRRSTCR